MEDIAIELKNINKSFTIHHEKSNSLFNYITSFYKKKNQEKLQVLKNISFVVKKGETVGVIGLNGCGKTTILKIISSIYFPDKGKLTINGKVIPILELGTGFNPELTAKENIVIYGIILGFSKKEITRKIDSIIQFADLEKFLDTKLKKFSSGMIARLAFSTAINVDPDILLIDEVLSVGDISFQEKSFNAFMEFKKREKTIIFVSHSLNQIKEICDKVIWLNNGVIQEMGETELVLKKYIESIK